jgi:hypothetical protein
MSRRPSRQDWTPGARVRVGFLTLEVVRKVPTPGDFEPDCYHLVANGKPYTFQPHLGLRAGWDQGRNSVASYA